MTKNKNAQSNVVESVLLILIVIAAIVIIMVFVINFVNKQLAGGSCFDVSDKIEVRNSAKYTCYNPTGDNMLVKIWVGDVKDKIKGYSIELGGASSKTYKIENKQPTSGVKLYNGSEILWIPGRGEEQTYNISNIDTKPDFVKVYPILKDDKICDAISQISVNECPEE